MNAIINDPDDISFLFASTALKNCGSNFNFFVSDLTLEEFGSQCLISIQIEFIQMVTFSGAEIKSIVKMYCENHKSCSLGNCSNIFFAQQHQALLITDEALMIAVAEKYNVKSVSVTSFLKDIKLLSIKI